MTRVIGFLKFLWDFVIGDDWRIAAAVTAALLVTLILANNDITAWWVLPLVVAVTLSGSLWAVARNRR